MNVVAATDVMARVGRRSHAVLAVAVGEFALLMATSGGYGYHRDELYFRVAGRHLAWGYPDQPPLTPLLGRVGTLLLGDSPRGLRVFPAIAICNLCLPDGADRTRTRR
jgi:hypothetical protein